MGACRALVAFQNPKSARVAADLNLPHLHVRQQQQRWSQAAVDLSNSDSPPDVLAITESEPSLSMPALATDAHHAENVADDERLLSPIKAPTIKRVALAASSTLSLEPILPVAVVQDSDSASERFMVTLERPPSMVLARKMQANEASLGNSGSIQLEDVESAPNSPIGLQRTAEPTAPSSVKSEEDDIVEVAARAEGQSSSAALSSAKNISNKNVDRGTNQERESSSGRTLSAAAHGGDNSSPMNYYYAPSGESNDDSRSTQWNTNNPQLRITVRTHGTVDSTKTQEKLKPQTLRSTEDLIATAVATAARYPAVHESPRVKKSGFITDIKQILRRKKTPPSPELAMKLAVDTTNASGNPRQHDEVIRSGLSPTRSFSLPTLASNEDFTKLEYNHELSISHVKLSSERAKPPIASQNAETQTLAQPSQREFADKATETERQLPVEHRDESESLALLSTLEGKLKNVQKVSCLNCVCSLSQCLAQLSDFCPTF